LIGWILYEQSGIKEGKRARIIMDKIRGVKAYCRKESGFLEKSAH
jgi:hypothetical protein